MGLCQCVDLCFHSSSLPCLHTFWHAIPTSFYIFNVFYAHCSLGSDSCSFLLSKDSPATDSDKSSPDWRSVPLPDATPGRQRNVSRLRSMGGDPTCVPPDFNSSMLEIWEECGTQCPRVAGSVSL